MRDTFSRGVLIGPVMLRKLCRLGHHAMRRQSVSQHPARKRGAVDVHAAFKESVINVGQDAFSGPLVGSHLENRMLQHYQLRAF